MHDALEQLQCFFGISMVSRCNGVFRHGNGGKAFRKDITAFTQRSSVFHHFKIHASVGIETMSLDKVDTAF